jgi:hypothetical protein
MSVICPRCGKDNTIPFSDSVYHTHGFECQDCKKDFGVDDGTKLKEWEQELLSLEYEREDKDHTKKIIEITIAEDKVTLTPSIIYPDKMKQPIESQDITPMKDNLLQLIFEKLYVLDWNRINVGFVTGKDETFELRLNFKTKPEISYSGTNRFPPYLKVLDQLFSSFFELQ